MPGGEDLRRTVMRASRASAFSTKGASGERRTRGVPTAISPRMQPSPHQSYAVHRFCASPGGGHAGRSPFNAHSN